MLHFVRSPASHSHPLKQLMISCRLFLSIALITIGSHILPAQEIYQPTWQSLKKLLNTMARLFLRTAVQVMAPPLQ